MGFLDKYLQDTHEDADLDFKEGDKKDGDKMDDVIGYIHDLMEKFKGHEAKLDELLRRTEHKPDNEQEKDLKDEEHKLETEKKEEKKDDE